MVITNRVGLFAFFNVVDDKLIEDSDWLRSRRVMEIVGKDVDAATENGATLVGQVKLSQSHYATLVSLGDGDVKLLHGGPHLPFNAVVPLEHYC